MVFFWVISICWIVPLSRSKQTLELNAEGLPDTILHSEESVVINVQIFNVSMTIRRAGRRCDEGNRETILHSQAVTLQHPDKLTVF